MTDEPRFIITGHANFEATPPCDTLTESSVVPVEDRSFGSFTSTNGGSLMGVKAMFYVNAVGHNASGVGTVALNATTKGDYAKWAKYTPSGNISITSLNDDATAWFFERLGKDVAITFGDPTEDDLLSK